MLLVRSLRSCLFSHSDFYLRLFGDVRADDDAQTYPDMKQLFEHLAMQRMADWGVHGVCVLCLRLAIRFTLAASNCWG